jgi:hypothetical protein
MKLSVHSPAALVLILYCVGAQPAIATPQLCDSTVGLPARTEQLVLPGTELEPAAWDDATPVVIRIEAVYPHGAAFRYDLVYQGLEPGEYDLRKFLRRKDGSSVDDLPPLVVTIHGLLPLGHVTPHDPPFSSLPWLGGYRVLLALVGVLWLMGLIWIVYPRRPASQVLGEGVVHVSLAERLRPLVSRAMRGQLTSVQTAELERALVSYWRRRLSLEDVPPVEALRRLRADPQAGPLVAQLESWLHRPQGGREVDIAALLAPYRDLPADDFDLEPVATEARAQ